MDKYGKERRKSYNRGILQNFHIEENTREGKLPNSFWEANKTLILKSVWTGQGNKVHANLIYEYRWENPI